MELYLTRHGQTTANVARKLQGHHDGELTELGVLQAQKLGNRLKSVNFDFVYSSDLGRCRETTSYITQHNGMTPEYDSRLREKAAGCLDGQPYGTLEKLAKQQGIAIRDYRPEDGESWWDVMARAQSFISDVLDQWIGRKGSRILVVCHGGFIMEFLNAVGTMSGQQPIFANVSKNTAVYIIRFQRARSAISAQIVVKNDATHLENSSGPSKPAIKHGKKIVRRK